MHEGRGFELGYRSSLDGLRGFSILAVLAFHALLPYSSGGFLGVAVFFTLSGFLITYLLCCEGQTTGTVSLRAFYRRRIRRLLPAFVLMAFVLLIYAFAVLSPAERGSYLRQVLAAMFYITNWLIAFEHWPQLAVLSHTWSLSIEEQFYSLWPALVILALGRGRSPQRFLGLIVLGFVASAATRAYLFDAYESHSRAYYGSDSNACMLLSGCAVGVMAAYGKLPRGRLAVLGLRIASWIAALSIVFACMVATVDAPYMYRAGFAGFALASAVLLLGVLVEPRGVLARLLATRPLVAIGRISYALYLWHLPVYLIARVHLAGQPHHVVNAVGISTTFACAIGSWFLIEARFIERKRARQRDR